MTSRVSVIRRGAAQVLKQLAVKFDELNDRSSRPVDPEASPLAQIQRLMLHDDPSVQRAALDAMQSISAPTCSLYTATDEVVAINRAHQAEKERDMGEAEEQASTGHGSPLRDAFSEAETASRLQTGFSSPLSPASRLFTGASANQDAVEQPHITTEDLLQQSDSDEGGEETEDESEAEEIAAKPPPPVNRPVVLPIAFRKEQAVRAARAREAAAAETEN
jgi:hypothetical protein